MTLIVSVTIFSEENILLKLATDELENAAVIFAGILIGFQMNGRISMQLECLCAKER